MEFKMAFFNGNITADSPFVFIHGYVGGDSKYSPSGFNIWDLSEAKVCRNNKAGMTRKNLKNTRPQLSLCTDDLILSAF